MKKQWLTILVGLTLALTVVGVAFALNSDGSTPPAQEGVGEPEPSGDQIPIRSDEGIDPNECNWVHNITACEGEPEPGFALGEPSPGAGPEWTIRDTPKGQIKLPVHREPGIAVGEPYPLPVSKECGPVATVSITSDGEVSCFDLGDGTGGPGQEPGSPAVEPQPPVTIIDGMDPNGCNYIHNINACFSDGQAPAVVPMDEYMAVLRLAREDLSQRLGVEIGSIKLAEIERAGWPVYWPEEPQPGVAYIELALAGFRMVLETDGQAYTYETDTSERVVFVG